MAMSYLIGHLLSLLLLTAQDTASWNSGPLQVTYQPLGWSGFACWAVSFYPQVILNLRRKSVVGLSFDYALLNLTKQSSYLIYNASMYFSSADQKQYFGEYGYGEMIPVAANDVAFSTHSVLLAAIILVQVLIYERGTQRVSKLAIGIVSAVWLTAVICFFVALPTDSWLWLVSTFNTIQVCMTVMKYIPQAVMNFKRKGTDGFSIGTILLDFSGGTANFGQMVGQSMDQGSWNNLLGNTGKLILSMVNSNRLFLNETDDGKVCIFFDMVFICQHYVLYPAKKAFRSLASTKPEDEIIEHLVRCSDEPEAADNV